MKAITFFLSCLLFIGVRADKTDIGLNPAAMIANHGYPSETHVVTTDDGYILTLYRIPHGLANSTSVRPAVFLMHGFSACAAQFVSLGPELGLGYILADAGYDVWLGNTRGTTFSRNHTTINADLNPDRYFNFTWNEIGYFDVASSIDFVLEQTGQEQLYYIGHSQGTTVLLVLLSTRPEYNEKVKMASLMAPAAIVKHYPNVFVQELCKYVDTIWSLFQKYNVYEIPMVTPLRNNVMTICRDYPEGTSDLVCELIYDRILSQIDKNMIPIVVSNCPSSAGLKQYIHYGQLVRDGGFRKYDFGKENNLKVYNAERPPDYDLSKISIPVAIYYAQHDGTIAAEDAETLATMLPNVVNSHLVTDESFGHKDFALSNKVVKLVYNELLQVMAKY